MTFISAQELKDLYTRSHLIDIDAYVAKAQEYLNKAVKRGNVNLENSLTVGLAPDYRVAQVRLYSAEDTTSPLVELDYGLLKNSEYTVPPNLIRPVEDRLDEKIRGLNNLGFTVEPFWGYSKSFGLLEDGVTYEEFRPVRCYKLKWSNS